LQLGGFYPLKSIADARHTPQIIHFSRIINHPAISNQIVIWELSTAKVANWGNRQNLWTNNHSVIDLIDTAAVCINACGPCYGRRWAGENIPTQQHKKWLWQTWVNNKPSIYPLVNVYITMENHHV
jgi:hypothetical protein